MRLLHDLLLLFQKFAEDLNGVCRIRGIEAEVTDLAMINAEDVWPQQVMCTKHYSSIWVPFH